MALRPDALRRHLGTLSALMLILLPVLEAAWVGWWLYVPLPNAKTPDNKPVRRGWILLRAIPEVVPDVTFHDSHLGQVLTELRHVENLPQRLPILLAAGLIAGAGLSLGGWIFRGLRLSPSLTRFERIPLAFGLGMVGLGTITLILGRLGLLNGWAMRVGLGGLLASGLWEHFATRGGEARKAPASRLPIAAFGLIVGPFLVLMALAAMLPTTDYDAIEYHLQGPKEYYLNGKITFLPHNVYTSMPFGVEMLHLLGMVVLGDWWRGEMVGQLLIMLHAPAAGAMIYLAASRWGSPRAGWFAAVAYLTTPWVFRLAAIPYVEGPLAYYHAALIYAAGWASARAGSYRPPSDKSNPAGNNRPYEDPPVLSMGPWGIVGALAGGAMACKYPALISAVIPFGLVALSTRSWRAVVGFGLGLTIAIGPWLVKNVVDTGNPVYPLGYGVFGGRDWNPAREAKWQNAHGAKLPSWKALGDNLIDVGGRSDWQSGLFVALAPLAFLRRGSHRISLVLWAYVSYLFATWWLLTHRLDRFWLPILPPLAILAGLGADWSRRRAWRVLLGMILAVVITTNFFYATTALTAFDEWTSDLNALRASVPKRVNPPLHLLDQTLPADAKPLLIGQAAVFHMKHRVLYNTVFNDETFEILAKGRSPQEVRKALLDRGITHVYVDWVEVIRHRKPGGYGFTTFIVPAEFEKLVDAGVLEPMAFTGDGHDLYRVR